jgi:NodT family efflux transporter outer membrane factor (OMF) lipoprotein
LRPALPGLLVLALAGCAHGLRPAPDVRVDPPIAWRTQAGSTALVDPGWWNAFGDPVLTDLVTHALARNTDLAIAVARIDEARAAERLARSQLWPSIDAVLGASYSRSLGPLGRPVEATVVQPAFQAAYEVDLFGRIRGQVDAARAGTLAADAARDAAALSVAAATASSYITLRSLDARLRTARETLVSRSEALRIARSRARVGYTSQLELRQAEAEYEATAQAVPQLELAIARQEDALSVLAGELPYPIERGATLAQLRVPPVPDVLPSSLVRRRPDIAQAEYALAASDATLASARAQFLPQVRLTASAGQLVTSALSDPVAVWSLGGSILAPLFNGGRIRAQVDSAAARRDQAAWAYRRTVLNAFREVEDALAATDRLARQRQHLEAQRAALAEALRHARNRYQAGYTGYLEQLDAQRALLNTELALAQVRADELNARVAAFQSLGGGWTSQEIARSSNGR